METMMDWTAIKGILTKDERNSVALALICAGYETRLTKRKGGNKTVIDVEYTGKEVKFRRCFNAKQNH